MNNKPDPALLQPSNLSNEIKKRVPKSRETIPLMAFTHTKKVYTQSFIKARIRIRIRSKRSGSDRIRIRNTATEHR
jgi:hypothetical protein